MILLAKIGLGFVGTALVTGAVVSSEGFIHVKVNEARTDGHHISLLVPAMLVPLTLEMVPKHYLKPAAQNLQPYMPVVDAALSGLANCPDGTLVEVTDHEQHATVVKQGGSIIVDVQDPEETVHVAVPLRATRNAIHEIADADGTI